jgi:hypothetical protein
MALEIMLKTGSRAGTSLSFTGEQVTVGRAPECDLILDDEGVSRQHCEMRLHSGQWWLRDLGTTNGTRLDGQRVEAAALSAQSVIEVGHARFVVTPRHQEVDGGNTFEDMADYRHLMPRSPLLDPIEIPIPHPSYRHSGKWVQVGLAPGALRLRIGIAALATVCLGLFALYLLRSDTNDPRSARSTHSVVLDLNSALPGSFGRGNVSSPAPSGLSITFDHPTGLAVISFDVGSIDGPRELEFLLNGTSLGFAPVAKATWYVGGMVLRPDPSLLTRTGNTLVLRPKKPQNGTENWGVRNIYLRHYPAYAKADLGQTDRKMLLAQGRYKNRLVAPENLANAVRHYREAALHALPSKPLDARFEEAMERYRAVDAELTKRFRQDYMNAHRAAARNSREEACRLFARMLASFTDRDDWRYLRTAETRNDLCNRG